MKSFLLLSFLVIYSHLALAQSLWNSVFHNTETQWVDSIFSTLSEEERIAQLFMVAAYSNKDEKHKDEISSLVQNYKIGGLMFLQGSPTKQVQLINHYQSIANTPLMIALDAEWGPAMRLDSIMRFPWQMCLGAIQDDKLIYEMGRQIARQCKMLGVNINFAPVADINSNPNNPIIGNRSFGEDKTQVAKLTVAYMKGMQDNGVLACAKHFPGHGDTDTDSHKTLPVIRHSKYRLNKTEIVPFKHLITKGLGSVMVAHIRIPSIDATENLASSLSKKVVTDILKKELGFQGLVFTDALNMKGVSKYFKVGELDVKALLAGNDILLMSEDVPIAIEKIKEAIISGEISQAEIDGRCKKILLAKKWMGLAMLSDIPTKELTQKINNSSAALTNRGLVENSITLLQNYDKLIPLESLDTLKIAAVSIGENNTYFSDMLNNYAPIQHFTINENLDAESREELLDKLADFNLVIASIHQSDENPWKKHTISRNTDLFLQSLAIQSKVIVSVFAYPYTLNNFLFTNNFDGLLLAYQNSNTAQELAAQSIFGGIALKGKLPVSTHHYKINSGLNTKAFRMKYTIAKEVNVNERLLYKIDSLVENAIKEKATPGCQIIIARNRKVFFQKSYGFHTYNKIQQVSNTDIYDLASITKIAATVPMLMKMQEEGGFSLEHKLGKLNERLYYTNKGQMRVKDVLAHQAGLQAWIPFYKKTINEDHTLRDTLYQNVFSAKYPIKVTEDLFLHHSYSDSVMLEIVESDLLETIKYQYSDLGYYLFKDIIEERYNQPLNKLVAKEFYNPLGLATMTYLPNEKFEKDRIVPTENDNYFRNQLLVGDVHDMGAAMLGGVGGHAGLFSNANDLAILMQMYLQEGQYANKQYFKPSIIKTYTKCQFCQDDNRRGAGFDKPELPDQEGGATCQCISLSSFGHSGFTGTLAWADPETEIVFVFLSNRIHPIAENKKLLDMDVRTNIMQVIFDAIQ
ncbi:MAG: glycoside hydrolase family 3 N-terminal domain-containing protein [Bacteroidota bacterium]|nr:glycoside hydrolase family 3 N-terminal domain-containing protein [Bacteroidota bacterium]